VHTGDVSGEGSGREPLFAGPQNPCHYLLRIDSYDSQAVQKMTCTAAQRQYRFRSAGSQHFYLGTIDEFVRASVEPF
jgi:hypothetical protein